jgi:hypothetical protein
MTSAMAKGRTIIVGDVHGCAEELEQLFEKVHVARNDHVVFVGDLVAKGPDSRGVVALARSCNATIVRGNHEEKLLQWRAAERKGQPDKVPLSRVHREVAEAFTREDWAMIEGTPFFVELPDHDALVVHAGVDPTLPLASQKPDVMMRVRTVKDGKATDKGDGKGSHLWGELYKGPPHVVFGHNAAPGLQLHPWATGLDTGCVYGGQLTAMLLDPGERIPSNPDARKRVLVHVKALRTYSEPGAPPPPGEAANS